MLKIFLLTLLMISYTTIAVRACGNHIKFSKRSLEQQAIRKIFLMLVIYLNTP